MVRKNIQEFISVASATAAKLNSYSIENDGENIHVYDAFIIRLLSQVLQLPYKILLPSDNEFGAKLPDGNWTGIIGMVQRSEADFGVCSAITYPRFQAINFSYPYLFSDVTFMTDKPKPDPTILNIIYQFPLILWILLISALFFFSSVLFVHVNSRHSYRDVLFMLFGSLLEKSIGMQLRKTSLKMIISTWLIFVFVIINSYKAVLLSIITLPPLAGIRDITDLAKAAEENSITCFTDRGSALHHSLLKSEFATWRSVGECLQRNVMTLEDAEVAFLKAPSKKAYIGARSYLKPFEETYFTSEDSFFYSMHAFSVSKLFRRQSYLNERIHRLFAAGLFQKIEKDEQLILKLSMTPSESNQPGRPKILQLEDLKGPFIVLLSGYALSTIVLCIEMAVKRYFPKLNVTLSKKRRKNLRKMHKRLTNCTHIF